MLHCGLCTLFCAIDVLFHPNTKEDHFIYSEFDLQADGAAASYHCCFLIV